MRDRTILRQIMGLCIMLMSVTGCTTLGATPNPSPTALALAGIDISEIDCANLITAGTIGQEAFERYGLAEKLQNNEFAVREHAGYVFCATGQSGLDEDLVLFYADMYYMFDAESGELVVTNVALEREIPESLATPEPIEHTRQDPICSDYVTPEVFGLEAWEKYGIADKLRNTQYKQHVAEFANTISCSFDRTIDGMRVSGDYVFFLFDIESGSPLKERIHWRENFPEHLPSPRISRQEAVALAMFEEPVLDSYLTILSPGQLLFGSMPTSCFQEPCWFVTGWVRTGEYYEQSGSIINAVTGEVLVP